MICSFTLGLYPVQKEKRILKYINYEYLKKILLEEGFSKEELKKIIVSNFLTKDICFEDKKYYIKISSIDSECTLKLLKLLFFYKITNHALSINDIEFKIVNIYHNSLWAKQLDIEMFLDRQIYSKEIELKFLTPTFFKIGTQYVVSLEPIYIFKNLIKKIKSSSLYEENKDGILKKLEKFDISKIKIKEDNTTKKEIKKLNTEGIVGKIIFEILTTDEEQILLFNFILYFAFFSGIGYLSEKGYGQNISDLFILDE